MPIPLRVAFLLILVSLAGCAESESSVAQGDNAELSAFLEVCPLTVRAVGASGETESLSVVRPEHISRVEPVASFVEGEHAVLVHLGDEGGQRMLRYTESHSGQEMAVYCGEDELYRATILEPFASPFRVVLRDEVGPN